jgi:hypothetical protein
MTPNSPFGTNTCGETSLSPRWVTMTTVISLPLFQHGDFR